MVPTRHAEFLGKIAIDLRRALASRVRSGMPGRPQARVIASGDGWSVDDVICTSGPRDRSFEEQHDGVSIAVVAAGSFQYRSSTGRAMLTPGSLLLGNAGQCFECGHEHAAGDRCIAFRYAPDLFEQIATGDAFRTAHLPPVRELAPLATRAAAGVALSIAVSWEETAVELAASALRLTTNAAAATPSVSSAAARRVTESVRRIEADPGAPWTLTQLARESRQSPFHYLRIFQQLTGVTPHQFVMRARLRAAALHLLASDAKIIDIALAAGFGDVSNFNAAFRREFRVAPRAYRRRASK